MSRVGRFVAVSALLCLIVVGAGSVAAQEAEPQRVRNIVVTTEVLGSVVSDLVGETAEVRVLMSGGADPHSWQPSARDTESIYNADLIIANGLALEEGLVEILDRAADDGVPIFLAMDHTAVRALDGSDHDHDADHDHGADDPHFWLDPLAMRDVVRALGKSLADAGVVVDDPTAVEAGAGADLLDELEALDMELVGILSSVPDDQRKLVTGHESLGYFADRYGFNVIGTVIPGLTTSAEPTARDLADLVTSVRSEGASAVFTEIATPQSVARVLADEAGAQIVELELARLLDGGRYPDLMRDLATTIADGLSPEA